MKIYEGDVTIECSAEEFLKIKDDLLDAEEENSVKLEVPLQVPLFDDFNKIIDKWNSSLYRSLNYD